MPEAQQHAGNGHPDAAPTKALRDLIIEAEDLSPEVVDVPEWGVKLEIRGMTGGQRAKLFARSTKPDGQVDAEKFYPLVLIACCFDPVTGERVFADTDIEAVNAKSSAVLERLAQLALGTSGMTGEAVATLGNASEPIPSGASTSS